MRNKTVLLEIGAEEIPARFLPVARNALLSNFTDILRQEYIDYPVENYKPLCSVYATPRRLAIIIDIAPRQRDRVREAFGPPKSAAFDRDGNPTRAALGFARSQGVDPKELVIKPKEGKGEYVAVEIKEKGLPTEELLPEILKKVILSIAFPKSMRWGSGDMRFARPIHWVLAIFGNQPVSFELDGVKSGNRSRGHRFLAPKTFALRKPVDYVDELRRRFVVVDQSERVDMIKRQADELSRTVDGTPFYISHNYPLMVADLVEYPQVVLGSFDEKYLNLPDELLGSVMWGHQKYFSVVNNLADKKLKNYFIIVSNTFADNADTVRTGAERVLRARFEDARFYFEEDRKVRLDDRVEGLKKVTFHDRLGTLHAKTLKVRAVAVALAEALCPDKKEKAIRAAELSKTDLMTGVVREFPELQGIMGMYYAREDGEEEEVAHAIMEQYLPAFSGDRAPETDTGAVLALADRIDNLASFFSIGLKPTGSEDPFALRRQALGVIAILAERDLDISIRDVLGPALSNAEGAENVEGEVLEFFRQRLEPLLGARGYEHDLVQSVISRSADVPLKDLLSRLDALKEFKTHARYNEFLVAIKRVRNITPEDALPPADKTLFVEDAEGRLHEKLLSVRESEAFVAPVSYGGAIERLLALTDPINTFFDKVLVMDKDEKLRNNRLAMLKEIWSLAFVVADFSRLQERGESSP